MKLFFDLDGTLLDSRKRLHTLFVRLANHPITFEDYWASKRGYRSNRWILEQAGFSPRAIDSFLREWMAQIEDWELLLLDTIHPGVEEALETLADTAELYVVTARQSRERLLKQLDHHGILDRFAEILNTAQNCSKDNLVKNHGIPVTPDDCLIGDTGEDILAGRKLGIRTIAVTCGFRDEASLRAHEPDHIEDDIPAVANLLARNPAKPSERHPR